MQVASPTPMQPGVFKRLLQFVKLATTVEAPLTETLVSGQLFLRPPNQNPVLLASIQTLVFSILVSGQLQLRTLLTRPEGVRLREFRL